MACVINHAKLGQLRGLKAAPGLSQFLGIPYGSISQRFARSKLLSNIPRHESSDFFDASKAGPSSIQPRGSIKIDASANQFPTDDLPDDELQLEDCLNLSITVPDSVLREGSSSSLPVVVFVHGGAFFLGSANRPYYNPLPFCKHALQRDTPVVFVAINYRLGALGFLHCPEAPELVPENNGLHDQLVALDWVREFVGGFGGDPHNITILGQSAGGESISLQALSDQLESPVYKRAIMLSGSPVTMPAMSPEEHGNNFRKQAEKLGIKINDHSDTRKMVKEMIDCDVEDIRKLAFVGAPCSKSQMLPYDKPSMELARNKLQGQGSWVEAQIVSSTTYDGGISYNMIKKDKNREDHAVAIISIAKDVLGEPEAANLLKLYGIRKQDDDDEALIKICQFESDIGFFAGALSMAQGQRAKETYMQLFDLGNPFEGPLEKGRFATHTWDITALLGGFEDRIPPSYKSVVSAWRDKILDFVTSGSPPCQTWNEEGGSALLVDDQGVREVCGEEYMSEDSARRKGLFELAERVSGDSGCDILWEKVCRRFLMAGK